MARQTKTELDPIFQSGALIQRRPTTVRVPTPILKLGVDSGATGVIEGVSKALTQAAKFKFQSELQEHIEMGLAPFDDETQEAIEEGIEQAAAESDEIEPRVSTPEESAIEEEDLEDKVDATEDIKLNIEQTKPDRWLEKLAALGDAQDQGEMSTAAVTMRVQSIVRQASNANPFLTQMYRQVANEVLNSYRYQIAEAGALDSEAPYATRLFEAAPSRIVSSQQKGRTPRLLETSQPRVAPTQGHQGLILDPRDRGSWGKETQPIPQQQDTQSIIPQKLDPPPKPPTTSSPLDQPFVFPR